MPVAALVNALIHFMVPAEEFQDPDTCLPMWIGIFIIHAVILLLQFMYRLSDILSVLRVPCQLPDFFMQASSYQRFRQGT